MAPTLVLLNGPPGVGKSTLAARIVADRPLALLLDIDLVRAQLGRWQAVGAPARSAARELAVAMARTHLAAGHDVVVPQLLGRSAFVATLEALASEAGARFVEVLLRVDATIGLERFLARRTVLHANGEDHPEGEVPADDVIEMMTSTIRALDALADSRPGTVVVDATGDVEATIGGLGVVLASFD